jgi:hypothetical protein
MTPSGSRSRALSEVLECNIIFVSGKGGVGKTVVSQAIASRLANKGRRTLWVAFEDPFLPAGEIVKKGKNLSWLNCEAGHAFQEYIGMKIGAPALAQIFLQNSIIQYMAKAAPGIHELVLLGKIWHERLNYDHVICDMPSTGYGLAMFHSVKNFARLFSGGPIHRDAEAMLETFADPAQAGQLIVSLPEEMPLRESLELTDFLLTIFPDGVPAFILNRSMPRVPSADSLPDPDQWKSPVPENALDFLRKRARLEEHNLRLWRDAQIHWTRLPYLPPSIDESQLPARLEKELA